jgi:hypothetical protein
MSKDTRLLMIQTKIEKDEIKIEVWDVPGNFFRWDVQYFYNCVFKCIYLKK